MAFTDVVFPEVACKGVKRDESVPLETIGNGTIEDRSTSVRWGGFMWTISAVGLENDTMKQLTSFLRRRHYQRDSFKYKDPFHPEMDNEVLAHYSGTGWKLYLSDYDDGTTTNVAGTHPVFHPDMGSIVILVDDVPDSGTLSVINGEPILTIPGTTGTEVVKVSGPYWLSVRLASRWGWTLTTLNDAGPNSGVTSDIILKEVFEY